MPSPIALTVAYSLSAAISVSAAFAIFRRREVRGGRFLGLMLLAAAIWAACDAIELHLPTVEGRRLISQIQYFGVVSCVPFFFHAAMALARLESRITPTVRVMIWGIPVISLVMAWTSRWHSWLWVSIEMPKNGSPFSTYVYGPWFWVLAAQHYGMTALNTAVLLWARRRVTHAFRAPMMAVVVVLVISWVGNILYIFKLGPWPGLNYLTISLGLSGAVLAWAVVREGLLDLLPRAREALLERERERLIAELKSALSEVRTLKELLPICASCKKVRDDQGYWSQIDVYLRTRAAVEFTHGICPDCDARLYGYLTEPVPE